MRSSNCRLVGSLFGIFFSVFIFYFLFYFFGIGKMLSEASASFVVVAGALCLIS